MVIIGKYRTIVDPAVGVNDKHAVAGNKGMIKSIVTSGAINMRPRWGRVWRTWLSFYKDIIAGHVSSVEVAKDERYLGKVYWDKESHYFIDGDAPRSNNIPILKYNTQTKIYSSFKKQDDNSWIEYKIS